MSAPFRLLALVVLAVPLVLLSPVRTSAQVMWDEHGFDLQRAYQVACLIYGSDPDGFSDLADSVDLPDDRRESCLDDWDKAQSAWFGLLEPYILAGGVRRKGVRVVHEPPARGQEEVAVFLRETEVLDVMARNVLSRFELPERITVATKSFGEPNAFWDAATAEITICYELADFYRKLIVADIENRSP
ncbi:DUF4344 domain-containing metallopeptidase [Rhodospirillum sp. A1_3_36]|uniref:DUF4344 domain-containing metallopeptidase n=1 Tax=Rhodospirillum sp. A1_3_36 TaxID=3391666 RepID=UPI0039A57A2C